MDCFVVAYRRFRLVFVQNAAGGCAHVVAGCHGNSRVADLTRPAHEKIPRTHVATGARKAMDRGDMLR